MASWGLRKAPYSGLRIQARTARLSRRADVPERVSRMSSSDQQCVRTGEHPGPSAVHDNRAGFGWTDDEAAASAEPGGDPHRDAGQRDARRVPGELRVPPADPGEVRLRGGGGWRQGPGTPVAPGLRRHEL